MTNSMMTIEIYRHAGTWCFTDEARGLLHEPFVLGIPEMIDKIIESTNKNNEEDRYRITFSAQEFPLCSTKLHKREDDCGGSWYELESALATEINQRGWLCPATLKFFSDFPDTIYFDVNPHN